MGNGQTLLRRAQIVRPVCCTSCSHHVSILLTLLCLLAGTECSSSCSEAVRQSSVWAMTASLRGDRCCCCCCCCLSAIFFCRKGHPSLGATGQEKQKIARYNCHQQSSLILFHYSMHSELAQEDDTRHPSDADNLDDVSPRLLYSLVELALVCVSGRWEVKRGACGGWCDRNPLYL